MSATLFAVIERLLALVDAISTANTGITWLTGTPENPLLRAIDKTADRYEERFPAIREQLKAGLASSRMREALQVLVRAGRSSDAEVVEGLVETGLFLPDEHERNSAREVASFLLAAFNNELLQDVRIGPVAHDEREGARHAATYGAVVQVDARIQQIATALGVEPEQRLRSYRERARKLPPPAALAYLDAAEEDLRATPGAWTRAVESGLYTERGAAAWRGGDEVLAKKCFERAYDENPADKRAVLNSALGLALGGETQEGLARINTVLAREPNDGAAIAAKAQLLSLTGRNAEVVALLAPLTLAADADSDHVRLYVGACLQEGMHDEAVAAVERCLKSRTGMAEQATVGLAYASRAEFKTHRGQHDRQTLADLEAARAAYLSVIDSKDLELVPRERMYSLVNLANVSIALGHTEDGLRWARQAVDVAPGDSRACCTFALVALAAGRAEDALRVVEPLAKAGDETARELAIAAYAAKKQSATVEQLVQFMRQVGAEPQSLGPNSFSALLAAALRESFEEAEQFVAGWTKGSAAHKALASARIAAGRGDIAGTRERLSALLQDLGGSIEPPLVYSVAQVAYANGLADVAVRALDLLKVNSASPEPIVELYLGALLALKGEQGHRRVLELAAASAGGDPPYEAILHAEATVREQRGELERAQELWGQLTDRSPGASQYWAALARCAYRRGYAEEAKRALAKLDATSELQPRELFLVAELRRRLGQYSAAIADAYRALEAAPHEPSVASGYMVLAASIPDNLRGDQTPTCVDKDVVVTLRFRDGATSHVVISDGPVPFDAMRYSQDSSVATMLRGKRTGEVIQWAQGPGGSVVEAEIAELHSKYRYAAATLFAGVPHRFPGVSPIAAFKVGENLEGMKRELEKLQASQDKIIEVAKTQPVLVSTVAKMAGRDIFRTWSSLEQMGIRVLVRSGIQQDDAREERALNECTAAVLDATTLLDVKALGLLAKVKARFGRILVPQQVYDDLADARDSLRDDRARGELMSVAIEGGEMVRLVVTAEQLDATIAFLTEILEYCEREIERVGRGRELRERELALEEVVGDAALASLAVAEEHAQSGARLFASEFIMRVLGRELVGVQGFGLLSFLAGELRAGRMSMPEFANAMRFCLRRMRYVPIFPDFLTYLALESRLQDYSAAVEAVLAPETEKRSALSVSAAHIRQVALQANVWEAVFPYLTAIMARIAGRYGREALRAIRTILESPKLVIVPNVERAAGMLRVLEKVGPESALLSP